MQIILMHSRFTQAKSVTLSARHVVYAVIGLITLIVVSGALMAALTLRLASSDLPILRSILPASTSSPLSGDPNSKDRYL